MSTGKELTFEIWRVSEKRTYYLMSAAGTGIGYSLATTGADQTLVVTRLILAALACWSVSFFLGLQVLNKLQTAMYLSKNIISNQREVSMMRPEFQRELDKIVEKQKNSLGTTTGLYRFAQLALLIIGAFLLISTKLDILTAIGWTK